MLHMSVFVPYGSLLSISGDTNPGVLQNILSESSKGGLFAKLESVIFNVMSSSLLSSSDIIFSWSTEIKLALLFARRASRLSIPLC